MNRKLQEFEWIGDEKQYLFMQYKNVEFSQLCTFDLMRLLRSSVKSRRAPISREKLADPRVRAIVATFADENLKFNRWQDRYEAALKRELGNRENLNPCQKRALNRRRGR